MWETISEVAASILSGAGSGGLLGVLGSLASGFLKNSRMAAEQALEAQRFEQRLRLQKLGQELASQQGAWKGLETSLAAEVAVNERVSGWVANVKALWRPLLTLLLLVLAAWIFYRMTPGDPSSYLSPEEQAGIIAYIIKSVVFTAATAVTWWFGDRAQAPARITG